MRQRTEEHTLAWHIQLFCNPMDYIPPGSSIHRISQVRILECVAISSCNGIFSPQETEPVVSCNGRQILSHWATWEVYKTLFNIYCKVINVDLTGNTLTHNNRLQQTPPSTTHERFCVISTKTLGFSYPQGRVKNTWNVLWLFLECLQSLSKPFKLVNKVF